MITDGWGGGYAPEEEKEKKCRYCGEDCDGEFCSKECKKAYLND